MLANNPRLRGAREQNRAAAAGVVSASALLNPEIEITTGNQAARSLTGTPGATRSVGLSMRLENPALRNARIAGAGHTSDAVLAGYAMAVNDVLAEARQRLFELALAR
ncbi:MAG: TolC family protein [Candidatus Protistobacter heckmanni]|nr:TolC family protein [Candidatus Protistobacter heckmanni]